MMFMGYDGKDHTIEVEIEDGTIADNVQRAKLTVDGKDFMSVVFYSSGRVGVLFYKDEKHNDGRYVLTGIDTANRPFGHLYFEEGNYVTA